MAGNLEEISEIRIVPLPSTHSIVKIYKGGRVFACTYAGHPDESKVMMDYYTSPEDFKPFNESTNEYILIDTQGEHLDTYPEVLAEDYGSGGNSE